MISESPSANAHRFRRGFMLDSARCLESRSYYRRFIDFIAERGIDTLLWHFTDDQGCALRFDCLPQAASTNAYSKSEMRELIAYARRRGIELIPELATLGHTRYITGLPEYADLAETEDFFSSISPVAPRTQQLISQLLDEVIELFDAPYVHIGLDEINIGGHPLTQEALEHRTAGELFAEHVNRLHAQLARHGRRAMMWADHLLAHPEIAPALPRDIVMCNWQYAPNATDKSTRQLLDWGFEVIACPAMISHNQTLFPGESFALPNLRAIAGHKDLGAQVVGSITTIWTPTRFLPDALWAGVQYAAAILRNGPDADPRQALRDFAHTFHGFGAADDWLDAMLSLMQNAPRREAWAAAARLQPDQDLDGLDLADDANRFAQIRAVVRRDRSAVKDNAHSYDRLMLLTDVLAHTWQRARALQADELTHEMLRRSEHLLEQLSQAWDNDRDAEDPRKHDCRLLYDTADHLLVAFGEGTRRIRDVLQAAGYVSGMAGY